MTDRTEIDARMHRASQALPQRRAPVGTPRSYTVGPLTMAHVFGPNDITNVSDWQAVLDAVEAALAGR